MKTLGILLALVMIATCEMQVVKSDDYLNLTIGETKLNFDIYGFYDYPGVSYP